MSLFFLISCHQNHQLSDMNILFLHHSTGGAIWKGSTTSTGNGFLNIVMNKLGVRSDRRAELPILIENYNREKGKNYSITDMFFPKSSPYGWNNYPYDYYNIWVKNAGDKPYMEEPTLEILTKQYQVIIFKHCFPVSNILADSVSTDINSDIKTIANYKLQYFALRDKLREFPNTKFILFTGAAEVKSAVSPDEANRVKEFFNWVKREWDQQDDNIYLWDLYDLQTEGGIYFKEEYAVSSNDSHPNDEFAGKVVKLLFNRIIDVIENNGTQTTITGMP